MTVPKYTRPSVVYSNPMQPNEVKVVMVGMKACKCPSAGQPSLRVSVCARCGGAMLTTNEKLKLARTQ